MAAKLTEEMGSLRTGPNIKYMLVVASYGVCFDCLL